MRALQSYEYHKLVQTSRKGFLRQLLPNHKKCRRKTTFMTSWKRMYSFVHSAFLCSCLGGRAVVAVMVVYLVYLSILFKISPGPPGRWSWNSTADFALFPCLGLQHCLACRKGLADPCSLAQPCTSKKMQNIAGRLSWTLTAVSALLEDVWRCLKYVRVWSKSSKRWLGSTSKLCPSVWKDCCPIEPHQHPLVRVLLGSWYGAWKIQSCFSFHVQAWRWK